ncbi:hypothetical protein QEW_3929 [Clostridioides difficile CD160]|nr:hypothetical protein QEW_3929 [Clostridioides difficile CD160]
MTFIACFETFLFYILFFSPFIPCAINVLIVFAVFSATSELFSLYFLEIISKQPSIIPPTIQASKMSTVSLFSIV